MLTPHDHGVHPGALLSLIVRVWCNGWQAIIQVVGVQFMTDTDDWNAGCRGQCAEGEAQVYGTLEACFLCCLESRRLHAVDMWERGKHQTLEYCDRRVQAHIRQAQQLLHLMCMVPRRAAVCVRWRGQVHLHVESGSTFQLLQGFLEGVLVCNRTNGVVLVVPGIAQRLLPILVWHDI